MKNSHDILNLFRKQKSFARLNEQNCFDFIKKLLPPMLSKQVRFIYHKGDTLFLVLNHPGAKMEIDYRLKSIKDLLKDALAKSCSQLLIVNIKTFVTNKPIAKEEPKNITIQTYKERSSGNFKITSKDEKIKTLFEEIQQQIHSKLS